MDKAVPGPSIKSEPWLRLARRGLIAGIWVPNISNEHLVHALELTEIVCVR
jgi:hypothetical protein